MVGFVLDAAPTATISLLILLIAVARWNLWGLLLAPILALSTIIGGKFNSMDFMAAAYGWQAYISIAIGLLVVGLDVIIYKKYGTKATVHKTWRLLLIILLNYLLYCTIQFIIYRLLTSGNPFVMNAEKYAVDISYNENGFVYIHYYMENGFVYNLFGLAATVIGAIIVRSQGVINNVQDKLIDDKKQAELDRLDAQSFGVRVEEESEEAKGEEILSTEDESQNCINKDGV